MCTHLPPNFKIVGSEDPLARAFERQRLQFSQKPVRIASRLDLGPHLGLATPLRCPQSWTLRHPLVQRETRPPGRRPSKHRHRDRSLSTGLSMCEFPIGSHFVRSLLSLLAFRAFLARLRSFFGLVLLWNLLSLPGLHVIARYGQKKLSWFSLQYLIVNRSRKFIASAMHSKLLLMPSPVIDRKLLLDPRLD